MASFFQTGEKGEDFLHQGQILMPILENIGPQVQIFFHRKGPKKFPVLRDADHPSTNYFRRGLPGHRLALEE